MEYSDDIMTIRDVAGFLKVKPVTIYKLLNLKKMPGIKISGTWRFKRCLIDDWIVNSEGKQGKVPVKIV